VAAPLHYLPRIQDHDLIGIPNRGQTMGDHEDRPFPHQPGDGLLDQPFRLRVQCAGGLVENQDRRVSKQCPSNRDPLALATGETGAALTQGGIVAVRQSFDEPSRIGRARRIFDLLPLGLR